MPSDILTGMKKLLVVLDDETANLLNGKVNKSAFVREAVKYMSMDINTDKMDGLRLSFKAVGQQLRILEGLTRELDSKVDYLARKVQ